MCLFILTECFTLSFPDVFMYMLAFCFLLIHTASRPSVLLTVMEAVTAMSSTVTISSSKAEWDGSCRESTTCSLGMGLGSVCGYQES